MERKINSWHSPAIGQDMPIVSYGHYGFALLLIPTAAADYLEYERFQLIDALARVSRIADEAIINTILLNDGSEKLATKMVNRKHFITGKLGKVRISGEILLG